MKNRRQSILIAALAAAITFGSLYVIAGERNFAKYGRGSQCKRAAHHDKEAARWYEQGERPSTPAYNE